MRRSFTHPFLVFFVRYFVPFFIQNFTTRCNRSIHSSFTVAKVHVYYKVQTILLSNDIHHYVHWKPMLTTAVSCPTEQSLLYIQMKHPTNSLKRSFSFKLKYLIHRHSNFSVITTNREEVSVVKSVLLTRFGAFICMDGSLHVIFRCSYWLVGLSIRLNDL